MNSEHLENTKKKADNESLDVVVVNYNSGDTLKQCLEYLLENQQHQPMDVFVVDNASQDQSIEAIKPFESQVKLVQNTHNKGFASACNQGAALGQSGHIAFVNPDCFVTCLQLHELANDLKMQSNAALVGCRVLNTDGSLQAASRRRLPTFWRVVFHVTGLARFPFFKGINIKESGIFDDVIEVEAVNGACYVVNRADFEQIGGFDEGFPLHFEDLDLFSRLLKQKKSILYRSNIEVKHLHGESKQDASQIKIWKKQGLQRYFEKHRPTWESKLVNLFLP